MLTSRFPRIWTYGVVGALATVIDYSMFLAAIYFLSFTPLPANVVGWCASLLVAYALHANFTFKEPMCLSGLFGFSIVSLSTLVFSSAVVFAAAHWMAPAEAKVVAIILTFGLGFFLAKTTVFRGVQ
jgi:putative flippase GtrA